MTYDKLVSTHAQLRYDEMSKGFAQVSYLATDDKVRSIIVWLMAE